MIPITIQWIVRFKILEHGLSHAESVEPTLVCCPGLFFIRIYRVRDNEKLWQLPGFLEIVTSTGPVRDQLTDGILFANGPGHGRVWTE